MNPHGLTQEQNAEPARQWRPPFLLVLAVVAVVGVVIYLAHRHLAAPASRDLVTGHTQPIDAVAYSPDGQTLAAANGESVKLWQLANSAASAASRRLDAGAVPPYPIVGSATPTLNSFSMCSTMAPPTSTPVVF
jgi:hypothetical protein